MFKEGWGETAEGTGVRPLCNVTACASAVASWNFDMETRHVAAALGRMGGFTFSHTPCTHCRTVLPGDALSPPANDQPGFPDATTLCAAVVVRVLAAFAPEFG